MIMKINLPKTKPRLSISRFLPIPIFRLGIISLIFFPFLLLSSCGMISTLEDVIDISRKEGTGNREQGTGGSN